MCNGYEYSWKSKPVHDVSLTFGGRFTAFCTKYHMQMAMLECIINKLHGVQSDRKQYALVVVAVLGSPVIFYFVYSIFLLWYLWFIICYFVSQEPIATYSVPIQSLPAEIWASEMPCSLEHISCTSWPGDTCWWTGIQDLTLYRPGIDFIIWCDLSGDGRHWM